ncbi:hypothetical protein [uncultured Fibrella sp.]|uniref:hypothetical protein n=1 Tax=uncultured Fibrella sp. TaxID=1284596 RepID=UPI0035CBB634
MATHGFFYYFNKNMEDMGLPAPQSLFDTQSRALATASAILNCLKTLGPSATMGEILGATTGLELLGVAAAVSASFYAGAVIGSVAVAAGEVLSDVLFASTSAPSTGTSVSQVMAFASRHNIQFPGLERILLAHPRILNSNALNRHGSYTRVA